MVARTAGTAAKADPVSPARTGLALPSGGAKMAAWFAAVAVYAAGLAAFSGPGHDRVWGIWAAGSYAASAAVAVCWRSRGTDAALVLSLAGALLAPVTWLLTVGPPANETKVLRQAALMLLHHGTPYLSATQIDHLSRVTAYNPYLPDMTVFGLPKALGWPGPLGSPTVWLIAATTVLFFLAFRAAGRPDPVRSTALAMTSPMIAFPLAVTITDPPVLGLVFLTFALLDRGTRTPRVVASAAILLGVACAMKTTAWLALPILAVMLARRDGARMAAKFTGISVAVGAVLFVAFAPALFIHPAELIQNTVLFPLGLTHIVTPAASPLPGHLLATAGPAGHRAAIALMVVAVLALATWIAFRPPTDVRSATWRLAVSLTVIFVLDPEARFGYFDYPLALCGWMALCYGVPRWRGRRRTAAPADPALAGSPGSPGSDGAASAS